MPGTSGGVSRSLGAWPKAVLYSVGAQVTRPMARSRASLRDDVKPGADAANSACAAAFGRFGLSSRVEGEVCFGPECYRLL